MMTNGEIPQHSCLIVDDEVDIRELLELTLERMGIHTDSAASVAEAKDLLAQHSYRLCLTDMRLPDGDGLELVRLIGQQYPGLPVAVITAYSSAENAVAALKAGAFDYLAKPISLKELRPLVQSAMRLSIKPDELSGNFSLIGDSAPIRQARAMIEKLARSQAPVYISGESGSGKELGARLIHYHSARREGPFVPVNCGAIPESLMESEFFGYKKGAFTGAQQDREGFFQAASSGTLFLDEVADLPLLMQVKLLRAIQEKKIRMVGSAQETAVDVRIISATHRNLGQMTESGQFRRDLYYRLNVIELKMPALCEMTEDIPALAANVMVRNCRNIGTPSPTLSAAAMEALQRHAFPGNVRELENILERAIALCNGTMIEVEDLLLEGSPTTEYSSEVPLPEYLEAIERKAIQDALDKAGNNKTAAAKLLGVSFRTLRYRLTKLGLGKQD